MKLSTVLQSAAGLAVGYVLGTAAGRGRYRQITSAATRAVQHPKVQQVMFDLAGQVKSNAGRIPGPAGGLVNTAATRLQDSMTAPTSSDLDSADATVEPTTESGPAL